jgi:threonine dehydratase
MNPPNSNHPELSRLAINQAHERIAGWIRQTPLFDIQSDFGPMQLKLECLQLSGSFKVRGAFNRLLQARASGKLTSAGVVAASGGNHGIAVATAARALQIKATIFLPQTAPAAKVSALSQLGATVVQVGERYAQALAASQVFQAEHHALSSHAYDQIETLQGQGTVASEWQAQTQAAPLDTVLIAVGGGGLIGGMAAWYSGRTKVVAVESAGCATLHTALAAGTPVDCPVSGVAADSLGATRIGELGFQVAQRYVGASLLVSDEAIVAAQRWAWQHLHLATEPGGATALAAVLSGQYKAAPNERIGVLLCGANVNLATLA